MTENYSGSTNIREKSSMHRRHKFYSKIIFRFKIPRTKIVLIAKITISTKFQKTFQLTNLPETLLTSQSYLADVTTVSALLLAHAAVLLRLLSLRFTCVVRPAINASYNLYGSHTCGSSLAKKMRKKEQKP
jgi:hypothetical protein